MGKFTDSIVTLVGQIRGALTQKADKVPSPTNGNLVAMDASGNLVNSGTSASSISSAVARKADKVPSPTDGNIVTMDANGNLVNSGKNFDDIIMPDNVVTTTDDQTIGGEKTFTEDVFAPGLAVTGTEGVGSYELQNNNWGINQSGVYWGKDDDYAPAFNKDEDNKRDGEGELGWNRIASLGEVNSILSALFPQWSKAGQRSYKEGDVYNWDGALYECIADYTTSASSQSPDEDADHWEFRRLDELYLRLRGGTLSGDLQVGGEESGAPAVAISASEGSVSASGGINTDTLRTGEGNGTITVPAKIDTLATLGDIGLPMFSPAVPFVEGQLVVYGEDDGDSSSDGEDAEPRPGPGPSPVPPSPDPANLTFGIYRCTVDHEGEWDPTHFEKIVNLKVDSEPTEGSSSLITSGAVAAALAHLVTKPTRIYNESGTDALDDKGGLHVSSVADSYYTITYNGGVSTKIVPYASFESVSKVPNMAFTWYYGSTPNAAGKIAYDPVTGKIYNSYYYGYMLADEIGTAQPGLDPRNIGVVLPDISGLNIRGFGACDIKFTPKQVTIDSSSYAHFSLESIPDREYSSSSTYAVGDLVKYGNPAKAYRCNTAISTPENWTAAHWEEIPVLDQKQDKLEVGKNLDDVPTEGSSNPITSGAAKDALDTLSDAIDEVRSELDAKLELRAPHVPFAITPVFDTDDSGSESSASDDSEEPVQWGIYLPKGSLYVNNGEVAVEGVENGFFPIMKEGDYYCSITLAGSSSDDSSSDSSDSSSYEPDYSKATPGACYAARIVMEPPEDDLFHFRVGTLKSMDDRAVDQRAWGAVHVTAPARTERIPFHIYEFTLDDEAGARTVYGMYTPADGTLKINKSTYRIQEAEGAWVWLDFDPYADGLYKYYCWYSYRKAHIGTYAWTARLADISFPVATIAVGNGNHGDKGDGENTQKSSGGVHVVVAGMGPELGGPLGSEIDVKNWNNFFSSCGADDVTVLKEGAMTSNAILGALSEACSHPDGLAVLSFSGRGRCDSPGNNYILTNDGEISDAQIWNIVKSARGKVWLIFDAGQSGTMYGPAEPVAKSGTRSMSESLSLLAAGEPEVQVQMQCWSAATDAGFAVRSAEFGGFFTRACLRYLTTTKTYAQVWQAVSGDKELGTFQVPQRTVMGDAWDTNVLDAPPAENTDVEHCYTGDGGYAPLPVIVKQRASGMMFLLDPDAPVEYRGQIPDIAPFKAFEVQVTPGDTTEYYIYMPEGSVEYEGDTINIYDVHGDQITNNFTTVNEGDFWLVIVENAQTGDKEAHLCEKEDIPENALSKTHLAKVSATGVINNYINTAVLNIQPPTVAGMTLTANGVFAPIYDTQGADPTVVTGFTNCFYQVGGFTIDMGAQSSLPGTDGFVCVKVDATGLSRAASLSIFATIADLQTAQGNPDFVITPLYLLQSSRIIADLRSIPTAQMMEVL